MTETALKALCNLLMCSDPTPVSSEDDAALTAFADAESRHHGYDGWIVAFHMIGQTAA